MTSGISAPPTGSIIFPKAITPLAWTWTVDALQGPRKKGCGSCALTVLVLLESPRSWPPCSQEPQTSPSDAVNLNGRAGGGGGGGGK